MRLLFYGEMIKTRIYDTMARYFWIPLTDKNWVGFTTLKEYYKRKRLPCKDRM